ncbi:MAG TPA: VOC family protein [Gemmatimonadaceae bacterium]|nr:VOC family protein [Gemmatimonadaceae bacterium]
MEAVIARLLNDFETGRLTRRQLVQTLALVAVGSPVASAVAQSAAASVAPQPAAPWKTVWLDHISYAVSDYKRSVDFYTGLMGWEVRNDNGTQAQLDINGVGGIIIRNARRPTQAGAAAGGSAPTTAPASPAADTGRGNAAAGNRAPITGVINHISWGVQPWDTEAVKAELERRGLNPRPDMVGENFKSFHVRDPDGWDLQISNQTKESRTVGGGAD